ncbi:MAG: sugar transferase [Alsobacter sp.]
MPTQPRGRARQGLPLGMLGLAADVVAVAGSITLIAAVLPAPPGTPSWRAIGLMAFAVILGLGCLTRCYSRAMLLHPVAGTLVRNASAPAVIGVLALLVGTGAARAWPLTIMAVLLPAAVLASREALAFALAQACRADLLHRSRVAVVSETRDGAAALARRLRADPDCSGVSIVPADLVLRGAWTPEDVDRIVVRASGLPSQSVDALRDALRAWPGPVDFVGTPRAVPTAHPHGGPGPVFARKRAPLAGAERAAKRAMDIFVAGLALLVLSPLLLSVALLMQIGRGQALVRIRRADFRGQPLGIYAFPAVDGGRLGETLQRTGLDQLPSLLNVLKGDLSLVGPSPLPIRVCDERQAAAVHAARQGLRPGLVHPLAEAWLGPAAPASPQAWAATTLAYCDEWSLGLDLVVLAGALGHLCTPVRKAWA